MAYDGADTSLLCRNASNWLHCKTICNNLPNYIILFSALSILSCRCKSVPQVTYQRQYTLLESEVSYNGGIIEHLQQPCLRLLTLVNEVFRMRK